METSTSNAPPVHLPESAAGRVVAAWWNFGQRMKRHIVPQLEREHGVDFGDFVHLSGIGAGAIYPGLLCERLSASPSNVSRMLDSLERRGYLTRSLDPEDSRRVRLALTGRGETALEAARSTMGRFVEAAFAEFSPGQRSDFAAALERANARLDRGDPA